MDNPTPEQIEKMWSEIEDALSIGSRRHYACGCVTVYQGKNKPEEPVVRCTDLHILRKTYFAARGKVENYERHREDPAYNNHGQYQRNYENALRDEHNALELLSSHFDNSKFVESKTEENV